MIAATLRDRLDFVRSAQLEASRLRQNSCLRLHAQACLGCRWQAPCIIHGARQAGQVALGQALADACCREHQQYVLDATVLSSSVALYAIAHRPSAAPSARPAPRAIEYERDYRVNVTARPLPFLLFRTGETSIEPRIPRIVHFVPPGLHKFGFIQFVRTRRPPT